MLPSPRCLMKPANSARTVSRDGHAPVDAAMNELPPFRGMTERFVMAALTVLVGVMAIRWTLSLLATMAVPLTAIAVLLTVVLLVRYWHDRTGW